MTYGLHPPATRLNIGLTTTNGGHVFAPSSYDSMTIDVFAYEVGKHNGPRCLQCKQTWCHHCEPDIYEEKCPGTDVRPFYVEHYDTGLDNEYHVVSRKNGFVWAMFADFGAEPSAEDRAKQYAAFLNRELT